jgi:3'-phosphoadenosine 5'-phosphosulfate sulfotransferase (PAPS reductase)/FAD synthetase
MTEPDALPPQSDPFLIEGPAVISFSGGRTSGYMLRRILDAHGGTLPPDVHVVFTNTGKERSETLDFIRDIELRWNVYVRWLEWRQPAIDSLGYAEVFYGTAARTGEPFSKLITWKSETREANGRGYGLLPTPAMRFCTQHLKIETAKRFIRGVLGFTDWTNAMGIRYDEPRRWRILGQDERNPHEFLVGPLVEAHVTEADVMAFWAAQPFDLQLRQHEGNCDLCFLKHPRKRERIMRERPDLAAWWIEQERRTGTTFRDDNPSYANLTAQGQLFEDGDSLTECYCHD